MKSAGKIIFRHNVSASNISYVWLKLKHTLGSKMDLKQTNQKKTPCPTMAKKVQQIFHYFKKPGPQYFIKRLSQAWKQ